MRTESQSGVLEDRTREILRMDDSILSVAIVDSKGRSLVSQSKFGAKAVFAPRELMIRMILGHGRGPPSR